MNHLSLKSAIRKGVFEGQLPVFARQNFQVSCHAVSKEKPSGIWHKLLIDVPRDFHRVFQAFYVNVCKNNTRLLVRFTFSQKCPQTG